MLFLFLLGQGVWIYHVRELKVKEFKMRAGIEIARPARTNAIFELPRIADLTIKTLQSVLVYSVTKKASIIALARSELI